MPIIRAMKRQRLAVVAYPVGRVGSSAMMGLLHLAGLHVGSDRSLFTPAAMNPKGFFELPEQERFLRETWSGIYPHVAIPPAARMVDRIAPEAAPAYGRLLDDALGGASPAAVKSQWCLTLPLLREMGGDLDVRVIYMERIREDQIDSLLRVWRASGDPARRHASRDFVAEFIDRWRAFGEETVKRCAFPVRRVSFDALVADPVPVVNDVAAFLEIEPPEEERIRAWLDPSLVNRKALSLGESEKAPERPAALGTGGARLSVVVNTRNAAPVLDGCLRSAAAVADEVVVVDMESDDGTEGIARRYTDRYFTVPHVGYVEPARQAAIEKATGDWVFVLDADERVSPALAPEDPEVLGAWAGLCRSTGRPEEAALLYEKSAGGGADGVNSLLAAGLCYYEAGRPREAKRVYERALAVDPECRIAAENLRVLAGTNP